MDTLFGHMIVSQLGSQAENMATEALKYILQKSPSALATFNQYLNKIKPGLAKAEKVKSQQYDEHDKSIPDLVLFDILGNQLAIVESKFWAGLTENQPVTYLSRLKTKTPSVLLFIVPEKRLNMIWAELCDRCGEKKVILKPLLAKGSTLSAEINNDHVMAVTSWRTLLSELLTQVEVSQDSSSKSDILQLQGLCDRMDADAFLPLDSCEISPMIATRNMQFSDLVDDVVNAGIAAKKCSTEGGSLRITKTIYVYGRAFKLGDYCCYVKFDNYMWKNFYNTPLWLGVYGKDWIGQGEKKKVHEVFLKLPQTWMTRYYQIDDGSAAIALSIALSAGKSEVVDALWRQIDELHDFLKQNYPV